MSTSGGVAVQALLASLGGAADSRSLSAAGFDHRQRASLARAGALACVRVGTTSVWTIPGIDPCSVPVAVAAAGPLAFAHRRSAGAVWGLDITPATSPEVAIAVERHSRHPGVHRVANLAIGDIVRHGGIRTTSTARTLADLGAVASADEVEAAVESALRLELVTEEALRAPALLERRWRGSVLGEVLARRPAEAPATGSLAETLFVQLCRHHRLPEPRRQWVQVLGRRYLLDFAWPPERVAVEVDGASVHGPGALGADLRRQNRVVMAGWLLLRFTWADMVGDADGVARLVRAALERGRLGEHALAR